MPRELTPELMDDPAADPEELRRALAYLRLVNRRFGGTRATLRHLSSWSRSWGKGRITILDLGTGSADIPVEVCRWGMARGFDVHATGLDLHERTIAEARRFLGSQDDVAGRVEVVRGDARGIVEEFGVGSFDYVHAGLFLHHLPDLGVLTVLRAMDRVARRGIIWSDLRRSRLAAALIEPMLWGRPRMVIHDARVSVKAGFTRAEVEDMARRLELGFASYRADPPFFYRFTFAGERPGAWGA